MCTVLILLKIRKKRIFRIYAQQGVTRIKNTQKIILCFWILDFENSRHVCLQQSKFFWNRWEMSRVPRSRKTWERLVRQETRIRLNRKIYDRQKSLISSVILDFNKFYRSLTHRVHLSSTLSSVQYISSIQKRHSFSAQKSLSSTPNTPQFNTPLRQKIALYKRGGTEGCVELRGF